MKVRSPEPNSTLERSSMIAISASAALVNRLVGPCSSTRTESMALEPISRPFGRFL